MSTEKPNIFSERLRHSRELRKMSQSDVAQRTGLQSSAVSHFETGRRAPSFDNLKRLADALDVTTDYLLGRVDDPTGRSVSTGPTINTICRNAENLSQADLQILAEFSDMLAKKNKG